MKRVLTFLLLSGAVIPAQALNVFACEPEWAALVSEIAGDKANVTSATTAFQDPHRVQARPSLIAAVRRAELLLCTGADLEVGWLPLLLQRSGNPAIQPGSDGYMLAADHVRRLEIPGSIDRSQGDIHPQGNPHIHLNPHNIDRVAIELAARLAKLDAGNAAAYAESLQRFRERWQTAIEGWERRAEKLEGLTLVSHHRSFSYLADWLKLDIAASLEPKPGVPASTAYLATLIDRFGSDKPAAIVRTPYTDARPSLWLAEKIGVPALVLPYTVGGSDAASNLFQLFDRSIAALENVAQ